MKEKGDEDRESSAKEHLDWVMKERGGEARDASPRTQADTLDWVDVGSGFEEGVENGERGEGSSMKDGRMEGWKEGRRVQEGGHKA